MPLLVWMYAQTESNRWSQRWHIPDYYHTQKCKFTIKPLHESYYDNFSINKEYILNHKGKLW
jgi:hypothetical protein